MVYSDLELMKLDLMRHMHWYDFDKGWSGTNKGWYEHEVFIKDVANYKEERLEIVDWLYDKIENPERHARWCCFDDKICVKFRFEKDYLWFKLSF